ncbi:MAG: hypothetical protein ABI846_03765 [Rudaea sp.]
MPQGDKRAYSAKQIRKAHDIESSYEDRGFSGKEAERRAWATVNKQDGGGLKATRPAKSAAKKTTASGAGTPVRKRAAKQTTVRRRSPAAARKTARKSGS